MGTGTLMREIDSPLLINSGAGSSRQLRDRLGVTHVDGNYHLTNEDYLNEGAKQIRNLGSRVIKVWFHYVSSQGETKYPYNSDWPDRFDSMVDIAEHPYFRELFQRDFRTYVLVAYSMNDEGGFWRGKGGKHYFIYGVNEDQLQKEERAFYELTTHLLEKYRGAGKEFVLQHWQGDWAILPHDTRDEISSVDIQADDPEPSETSIQGMIRWLNARQRGVERARSEIQSDVKVLHAAEVNMVIRAMRGQRRVINHVIPETTVDLVSHNSYREMWFAHSRWSLDETPDRFRDILDYVNSQAPETNEYTKATLLHPDKNVLVGEYGLPFTIVGDKEGTRVSKLATNVSLEWGATWTLFWQIYGNEHGKGFWLIRPDGTTTPLYDYFKRVISENKLAPLPTYAEYIFRFNRAVLEHEVNAEVSREDSRWLTIVCSKIELLNDFDEVIASYDIGVPAREPTMTKGVSGPNEHKRRTFRWFVGESKRNANTHIYIPKSISKRASELRLTAKPVQTADIDLTIVVGGEQTEVIDFPIGEGWKSYSVSLPTTIQTPTPSPTSTPTSLSTRSTTEVQHSTQSETGAATPGFTIPTTITGIAGAMGIWKIWRDGGIFDG